MREKTKTKGPARRKLVIERWTVDRIDDYAGMARIEAVPMRPDCLTEGLLKGLSKKGLETDLEDLSLWDTKRVKIKRMKIERLETRLGFRDKKEKETLSENMVFWVFNPDGRKKKEPIYHGTRAAREFAKTLYKKVARTERSSS